MSQGRGTSSSNYRGSSTHSTRPVSTRPPGRGKKKRRRRRRRIRISGRFVLFLAAIAVIIVLLVVFVGPRITGKPKLKLVGDATVTTAQGEPYVDEGVTATIRKKDVSDRVYVTDEVDTDQLGTYKLTYSVDGRRRTFSVSRKVEVTDQTGPEIILNGDAIVIVDTVDDYEELGATAIDNCDGDVTDQIVREVDQVNNYTWEVTYTAEDQVGNVGTAVREVQLHDDILPEIALKGDATIVMDANEPFDDPWVSATDNRDGDISDKVTVDGWVDVYRPDTYTLTYTATDTSGNTASVSRTVVVESVPSTAPQTIYLTFDDGPSSTITPQVLDILKENDIQATFFICDYSEENLPLIQRMIDEGHTIGIHGYSHDYSEIYTSVDAFMENIDKLADKLREDTGYEAFYIRFPGGSSNTVSAQYCEGIMTDLVRTVSEAGWMYMDWNISSGDASGDVIPTEEIISNVESELSTTRKNVILMHDLGEKQTTVDALQTIIDYGKENGYTFHAIEKDTVPIHQAVAN